MKLLGIVFVFFAFSIITNCCPLGQAMYSGNCVQCSSQIDNCTRCQDGIICTRCQPKFYIEWTSNTDNTCQNCPPNCAVCYRGDKCYICDQYYEKNSIKLCVPKCGDGYTLSPHQDCDILKGTNKDYDGCTNTCQIETGFECQVNSMISACYYSKDIPFKTDLISFNSRSKQITIKLTFDPVLKNFVNLYSQMNIFNSISVNSLKIKLLKLNTISSDEIEITFVALQVINFDNIGIQFRYSDLNQILSRVSNYTVDTDFNLYLDPQQSCGLRYFLLFYSIMSVILFFIGFLMKQVAGLQFALIVQFLGNSLLWYPQLNSIYFFDMGSLSYYTNGLNFHLSSNVQTANSTSQQIGLSTFLFSNWNFMPIVGMLSIALGCVLIKILQINYQRLSQTRIRRYFITTTKQDFSEYYIDLIVFDWYFFVMMYNFQPFICYSLLFFTNIQIPTNIGSIVLFTFSCLLVVAWIIFTAIVIFKYLFRMYCFNILRKIFHDNIFRSKSYILLLIQFTIVYTVLCFTQDFVYVAFLFPIAMIIYYIVARPYILVRENVRVIVFQIMIMLIISMRVFYLMVPETGKNSIAYPLIILILMLIPLVWTIIMCLYGYVRDYVKRAAQIKFTNLLLQQSLKQRFNLPKDKSMNKQNEENILKEMIQPAEEKSKPMKKLLFIQTEQEQPDRKSQYNKFSKTFKNEMKIQRQTKQQQPRQINLDVPIINEEKSLTSQFRKTEKQYFMAKRIFDAKISLSPVHQTYLEEYDKI